MNKETLFLIGVLVLIASPLLLLLLRDRFSEWWMKRYFSNGRMEEDMKALRDRVMKPDWAFYEKHLGRPVPPELRRLYDDKDPALVDGFEFREDGFIMFCPLDEEAMAGESEVFGFEVLPFAHYEGDIVYLRPGASERNGVYITYLDGGDTEELAPDIGDFLKKGASRQK